MGGSINASHQLALSLYLRGMRVISDIWDSQARAPKTLFQLMARFRLEPQEIPVVQDLCHRVEQLFSQKLCTPCDTAPEGTWIGGYSWDASEDPAFLVQTCKNWNPGNLRNRSCLRGFPSGYPAYRVGKQSRILIPDQTAGLEEVIRRWNGPIRQARVTQVEKHKATKQSIWVYYGEPGALPHFDPAHWRWKNGKPFTMYSAKLGREFLSDKETLVKPVQDKWRHEAVITTRLKWKEVWADRSQKEAAFMWSMWHQAIATNTWRAKFNPQANPDCVVCVNGSQESYIHRFYTCPQS